MDILDAIDLVYKVHILARLTLGLIQNLIQLRCSRSAQADRR